MDKHIIKLLNLARELEERNSELEELGASITLIGAAIDGIEEIVCDMLGVPQDTASLYLHKAYDGTITEEESEKLYCRDWTADFIYGYIQGEFDDPAEVIHHIRKGLEDWSYIEQMQK